MHWHKDVLRLLGQHRKNRRADIANILNGVRKNTNSAYRGVVQGSRPSRRDRKDQEVAASMSRQNAAAYWLARINGNV